MTDAPITDPKALRALSHPFRWKLLQLLTEEGSRTATRCSAALGESVASCSYHLNMLAEYGFVAEVEGPGRQKPWKIVPKRRSISSEGLEGEAASTAHLDQEFERVRTRLRQYGLLPEEWRQVVGTEGTVEFVTAEEALALVEELRTLFDKYDERRLNPQLRPEGARAVRSSLSHTVAPEQHRTEGDPACSRTTMHLLSRITVSGSSRPTRPRAGSSGRPRRSRRNPNDAG